MTASLFGTSQAQNVNVNGTLVPQRFVATAGQTLFTITLFTYVLGTNSIIVFVNGLKKDITVDFTETSTGSFTLVTAAAAGTIVDVVGFPQVTLTTGLATGLLYTYPGVSAVQRTVQNRLQEKLSVKDFGAVGDGTVDDTAAINAAFASAVATNIREVFFPAGQYRITGKVTVPTLCRMVGETWLPDPANGQQNRMTSIYVDFGSGGAVGSGNHAIELSFSSAIDGFTFFYPGQVAKTAATPLSFDWAISTPQPPVSLYDNVSVKNITMYNAYAGINITNGGRFRVENIYGQVLKWGIRVDANFDACYMRAIHYYPIYTQFDNLETWVHNNSIAFDFRRTDDLNASDLFSYNANIAFNFTFGTGAGLWGMFTNISADFAVFPMVLDGHAQVTVANCTLITAPSNVNPCIWIKSGGISHFTNLNFGNNASIGVQIDGSISAQFTNCDFQNVGSAAVVTSSSANVQFDASCRFQVPPFGQNNVSIGGFPLPAPDVAVTLPATTSAPTVISGGFSFDLSTAGAKILQYDLTTPFQRNGLYLFSFDFELVGLSTTWYFQFSVDRDVGGQLQVSYQPTGPMNLAGTSGAAKRIRIPFFVNGCVFKTLITVQAIPTVTVVGASFKMTNIALTDVSNKRITDAGVAMMINKGYNLDFFGIGPSLFAKGPNRKIYPVLDGASGRTTEVPVNTVGAWAVGDEMITLVPASAGFIGRVCKTAGAPGTWTTFGAIT